MKKKTISQKLSERVGGNWRAVKIGFSYEYHCNDGRIAAPYFESVLDWDGYSDTKFNIVYYDQNGNFLMGSGGLYG